MRALQDDWLFYQLHTNYTPTTHQLHTNYTPTTHQLHTNYTPTTHQLHVHTNYTPTTHQLSDNKFVILWMSLPFPAQTHYDFYLGLEKAFLMTVNKTYFRT